MVHEQSPAEKQEPSAISSETMDAIKAEFIEFLEDFVTDPNAAMGFSPVSVNAPERVKNGEKIESHHRLRDRLVFIGQQKRLTPDQIDSVLEHFLLEDK